MRYGNELKVGLAIIATVLVFIFGFRFLSDLPLFRGSYELRTRLTEAGGLISGNPVLISGVRVGSVSNVALSEDQDAVNVRFRMDEDVTVFEGSTARIKGFGALGGVQLVIAPGPRSNAPIPPNGLVPADPRGDVLGELRSRTPQLVGRADSLLASVTAAARATNRLLSNSGGELDLTLAAIRRSTETLSRVLQSQEGRLANVLENAEATTQDLRAFTAGNTDSLALALTRFNQAMRRLNANLATLDTTTTRLNAVAARIETGEGTLGRLVNDPSLYIRLDSTATRLSFVLEDFQQNPGRYLEELTLVDIF